MQSRYLGASLCSNIDVTDKQARTESLMRVASAKLYAVNLKHHIKCTNLFSILVNSEITGLYDHEFTLEEHFVMLSHAGDH
jgi:hypothetical protein